MTRAFRVYAALVALLAAWLLFTADWGRFAQDSVMHWNGLAAFAVLGFVTEASYLRLRVGSTETQSSVAFIPYIASFLLFDTGWAASVAAASMCAVEVVVRRKPLIKVVFNSSQMVVSIAAASLVYKGLGGVVGSPGTPFDLHPIPVAAAVGVYFFLNSSAVSLAVSLALGEPFGAAWLRIAGASIGYDLLTSPLGAALAFLYSQFEVLGIVILVVPLYIVRHIYQVNLQLEQVNRDLLELMVKAIEARDPYTSGHSLRVSQIAELLAREFGLSQRAVEQIRTAALLHDVGKIHEEYAPLLRKEGKLDATERALMQTHSARSAELVSTISAFKGLITDAVRHHHENFDGSGYPSGLTGAAIPVGARIIMIADTMDAMTTDRPYRRALSFERVTQELERFAGRQFDPDLVRVCLRSNAIELLVAHRIEIQQGSLGERSEANAPRRLEPRFQTAMAGRRQAEPSSS